MRTRPFGTTGMTISALGLGTVKFGRNQGLKHPTPFSLPDDRQAAELLDLAADLGINLIDTAPAYGTSEERLGALLAGQQDRWIICTKVGEEFDAATVTSSFDFSPEHVRFSIERSLRRLRRDVLDIVLVHSDGNDLDIIERHGTMQALRDLKAEGKLRAFGLSSKTVEGGIASLDQGDCAMATYNRDHTVEAPVLDHAAATGKAILVKKPLASGHIDKADGIDPVEASFRFIFAHPGVTSAVMGTINPAHLRSNVGAVERALDALSRSRPAP